MLKNLFKILTNLIFPISFGRQTMLISGWIYKASKRASSFILLLDSFCFQMPSFLGEGPKKAVKFWYLAKPSFLRANFFRMKHADPSLTTHKKHIIVSRDIKTTNNPLSQHVKKVRYNPQFQNSPDNS